MLHIRVCISALVLTTLCLAAFRPQNDRSLPSVDLKSLNGKTVNLATVSNDGKPMILIAWEVTCQPAIAAFKNIAPLCPAWQAETGVKIVAISVDDSRSSSRVAPLVRSKGWPFEVYLDPNQSVRRAMNIPACPQAYVIDGNGEIVWQKSGYAPGDELVMYDAVKKAVADLTK